MRFIWYKAPYTPPKNKGDITVSYHNYKLVQKYRGKQCTHTFYKNGKRFEYRFGIHPIPRRTNKQLLNYLKYLVDTGIAAKFDTAYKTAKGILYYPTCFFEDKNKVNFVQSHNNSFDPEYSYVDDSDMFFNEDRYMDQLIEDGDNYINSDGYARNVGDSMFPD